MSQMHQIAEVFTVSHMYWLVPPSTRWPLSTANFAQNSPGNDFTMWYKVVLNSKSTKSTEKKMHPAGIEPTASTEHMYNNYPTAPSVHYNFCIYHHYLHVK